MTSASFDEARKLLAEKLAAKERELRDDMCPQGAAIHHSSEADKKEPDLLPCPFCGSEAGFGSSGAGYYFVNCFDCMASTNVLLEDRDRFTMEEAAAAWNRRSTGEPK